MRRCKFCLEEMASRYESREPWIHVDGSTWDRDCREIFAESDDTRPASPKIPCALTEGEEGTFEALE